MCIVNVLIPIIVVAAAVIAAVLTYFALQYYPDG